ENGEVEFGRLCKPDGFADLAGLGRHAVAKLFQHVRHHHSDHDLVLDEENRTARRARCRHRWNPCPFPGNQGWQIKPAGATLMRELRRSTERCGLPFAIIGGETSAPSTPERSPVPHREQGKRANFPLMPPVRVASIVRMMRARPPAITPLLYRY